MGIFNRAIPKYVVNPIDNSVSVTAVEEPVVIDDAFDPILNKRVQTQLTERYGNPIGATFGGYAEYLNNALLGDEQNGTMLPGLGILSGFGRTMDKAGDAILGTLTEGVKGITGQGMESPFYNIFVEDEDYSGQRLLAAAANSMSKMAGAPQLTEEDFGGAWTIPALGIDLATDPSILGGNLSNIAKGQGAVADAGRILQEYDDVMSKVAMDITAPGLRTSLKNFMDKLQTRITASESYRDMANTPLGTRNADINAYTDTVSTLPPKEFINVHRMNINNRDNVRKKALEDGVLSSYLDMFKQTADAEAEVIRNIIQNTDPLYPVVLDETANQKFINDILETAPNEQIVSKYVRKATNSNLKETLLKDIEQKTIEQNKLLRDLFEGKIEGLNPPKAYTPPTDWLKDTLNATGHLPVIRDDGTYGVPSKGLLYDLMTHENGYDIVEDFLYKSELDDRLQSKLWDAVRSFNTASLSDKYWLNKILEKAKNEGLTVNFNQEHGYSINIPKNNTDIDYSTAQDIRDELSEYYAKMADRKRSFNNAYAGVFKKLSASEQNLVNEKLSDYLNKTLGVSDDSVANYNRTHSTADVTQEYVGKTPEQRLKFTQSFYKSNPEVVHKLGTSISQDMSKLLKQAVDKGILTEKEAKSYGINRLIFSLKDEFKHDSTLLTDQFKQFNNEIFRSDTEVSKWYKEYFEKSDAEYRKTHKHSFIYDKEAVETFLNYVKNKYPDLVDHFNINYRGKTVEVLPTEIIKSHKLDTLSGTKNTTGMEIIREFESLDNFVKYAKENKMRVPKLDDTTKEIYPYYNKEFIDLILQDMTNPETSVEDSVNGVLKTIQDVLGGYHSKEVPAFGSDREATVGFVKHLAAFYGNDVSYINDNVRLANFLKTLANFQNKKYDTYLNDVDALYKFIYTPEYLNDFYKNNIDPDTAIRHSLENIDVDLTHKLKKQLSPYLAKREIINELVSEYDEYRPLLDALHGNLVYNSDSLGSSGTVRYLNSSIKNTYNANNEMSLDTLRKILNYKPTDSQYALQDLFEVDTVPKNIQEELLRQSGIPKIVSFLETASKNNEKIYLDTKVLKDNYGLTLKQFNTIKKAAITSFPVGFFANPSSKFIQDTISYNNNLGIDIVNKANKVLEDTRLELESLKIDGKLPENAVEQMTPNTKKMWEIYGNNIFNKQPKPIDTDYKGKYVTIVDYDILDNVIHSPRFQGTFDLNKYVQHIEIPSDKLPGQLAFNLPKDNLFDEEVDLVDKFYKDYSSIPTYSIDFKNPINKSTEEFVENTVTTMPKESFKKVLASPPDLKIEDTVKLSKAFNDNVESRVSDFIRMKMSDAVPPENLKTVAKSIYDSLETGSERTLFNMIDTQLTVSNKATSHTALETVPEVRSLIDTAYDLTNNKEKIRISKNIKKVLTTMSEIRGDTLAKENFVTEIFSANGLLEARYGKHETTLSNKVFTDLTENVKKINEHLGSEAFVVSKKDISDGTLISVYVNPKNQSLTSLTARPNWKGIDANKLGLVDIVFDPPKEIDEKTYSFLNSEDVTPITDLLKRTRSVASDYYTKAGFSGLNDPGYFKHTLIAQNSVYEHIAKTYYKDLKVEDIENISKAIVDSEDIGRLRGTFGMFPNARRFRGSISRYNRRGDIPMFSTNLENIVKSTFSKGIFANSNFQTTMGIFFNDNFNIKTYCRDVDDVKKIFYAAQPDGSRSGNLQNLILAAPKYDNSGKLTGFVKFDVTDDAQIKKALEVPNSTILPIHTFAVLDRMCKKDVKMSDNFYKTINTYITSPFKIGCLMNPAFILGNVSDAWLKQAMTMHQKYGTNLAEECYRVADCRRKIMNLNNFFDSAYQKVCNHMVEAGEKIPALDRVSANLMKNDTAKKRLVQYLNDSYTTSSGEKLMSRLTSKEINTIRVWLFLNTQHPTSFAGKLELDGEVFKYAKNPMDRILYGTSDYKNSNPSTWGTNNNPVTNFMFDVSSKWETEIRAAAILNDLEHKGINMKVIEDTIKNTETLSKEELENFHIEFVNAINTMNHSNFNYESTSDFFENVEYAVPFPTFWLKNIGYWLEALLENPTTIYHLYKVNDRLWANEDTEDEFKADAKARGAVPMSAIHQPKSGQNLSSFFKGIYKPSPLQSMYSAFNALNNPVENLTQRVHPIIQGAGVGFESALNTSDLTTNLFDSENIRYRPYNTNQYQPNINLGEKDFNPVEYTVHKINPYDRFTNTVLRTPGKIEKGEAQLSDFLPSVFQPDFSKK